LFRDSERRIIRITKNKIKDIVCFYTNAKKEKREEFF
jgi:hypothetical protein